jgi:prepilin-type N-terminal cleavage/methylation domain-containing protein
MLNKTHQHKLFQNKKAFSLIEISIVVLILGIMVAGIFNYNNFVLKSSLISARKITKSSTIIKIENLALWLDTTAQNSFKSDELADTVFLNDISDKQTIGWWQDVNLQKVYPARLNFTSSNLVNRPQYHVSAINNLPALYFDGNDFLRIENLLTNIIASENEITIFVVQNVKSSNLTTFTINSSTKNLANTGERIMLNAYYNNNFYFDFGNYNSSDRVTNVYNSAFYLAKPQIISAIKKGNSSSFYINSKPESTANTTSSLNTSLERYLEIGTSFDGYIGEILIYNRALRVRERMLIEQYLMKKWKIKILT